MIRMIHAAAVLAVGLGAARAEAPHEGPPPGLPAPLTDADFMAVDPAEARLGQLLFYDPILSGNREVSCATCHHPRFATSDGLALGLGDGGIGLGPDRRADPGNLPEQRIPRNSPALFNLGAHEVTVLFHDGRIEVDPTRPSGLRTPLGEEMVAGFANLLSAQTMFPVLSADEMGGHYQENEISLAVRMGRITGEGGAWHLISQRVAEIDAYAEAFARVYPHIGLQDAVGVGTGAGTGAGAGVGTGAGMGAGMGAGIGFTDISNAIAAFIAWEWRSDTSPFDAVLRGEGTLPEQAARGMELFYGRAGCAECHAGALLTDHGFHAMGQPQLGPGKAERFERHQNDVGRMRVTGRAEDAYAFRTPSLRNVAETGPWGHAGAFASLDAFLAHHADPVGGLARYVPAVALPELPDTRPDWAVMQDGAARGAIADAARARTPVALDTAERAAIIAFLGSLSDPAALSGRLGIPDAVPSGLRVER